MGPFVICELKRNIIHPKTWFMIIILFILSFQMIGDYRGESIRNPIESTFEFRGKQTERNGNRILFEYQKGPEISRSSAEILVDTGVQMRLAARQGDYIKWSRLNSFSNLIWAKAAAQNMHTGRKERLDLFEEASSLIWNDVSGGIPYEDIDFINGDPSLSTSFVSNLFKHSSYYHILYKNQLNPIGRYHVDSMTFIYHYINKVIPGLLGLLVLILVFDSISGDWSNGSLKLILTQPFSRRKYLLSKMTIGVLHTLFIIIIPIIVITLVLGITGGFGNYNYPVLSLEEGFTSLQTIPNYLEQDTNRFGNHWIMGISAYSQMPENSGISPRLTFMPLYQFLMLSVLLLTLCIIFYVSLNILISSITKNKIVGFSISGLVTLAGITISQRWVDGDQYNLSPFTMNNPVRILNGTYNSTALMAVIVLCLSGLFIFILNNLYYQRKDL